jgi:hypothetical protein
MSLESELADIFEKNDWHWRIKGHPEGVVPGEEDIEQALDEAARLLYNEDVGAQLEVGRLIIKKKHHGFDVYCFVGPYL